MKLLKNLSPTRIIALSFALVILVGTVLLALPVATREGQATSIFDALFTALSATCVIGVSLFDTYTHWTLFGQIVILILFQIGGLGIMSFIIMKHYYPANEVQNGIVENQYISLKEKLLKKECLE